MKRKVPLDPFDWKTPLSRDYQTGNLAWVSLLVGLVGGGILIGTADFAQYRGWLQLVAGVSILAWSIAFARKLFRSI